MNILRSGVLGLFALASAASADLLVSDYATIAADSQAVNATYGIRSFSNPASTTTVSVAEAGYIRLVCSKLASEGTIGYSAKVGLDHPFRKDGSKWILTGLTGISFEIRYSVEPTDGMEVILGSSVLPASESELGIAYAAQLSGSMLPQSPNTWKSVDLSFTDFQLPAWWTAPSNFPTLEDVLAGGVESIRFVPKTRYADTGSVDAKHCVQCVTPTTPAMTLDIRNIRLTGIEIEPILNADRGGCVGTYFQSVDAFEDGDHYNEVGGHWYAFSDTSSDPAKDLDSSRGSSAASLDIVPGEVGLANGFARVSGRMKKTVESEAFPWRPYAGWLGIETDLLAAQDLGCVTGFEFALDATYLGPQVKGIKFRVEVPGVERAYSHVAFIPARQITRGSADYSPSVCVRPEDLVQDSRVPAPSRAPFSAHQVSGFSWEAAIDDQVDPSISEDSVEFTLTNVGLHTASFQQFACRSEGVDRSTIASSSFGASYRSGVLSLSRPAGFDRITVVSSSGAVVKRLDSRANQLAMLLDRGTYFVLVRDGKGRSLSRTIAVVR